MIEGLVLFTLDQVLTVADGGPNSDQGYLLYGQRTKNGFYVFKVL